MKCRVALLTGFLLGMVLIARSAEPEADDVFTKKRIIAAMRKVRDYQLAYPWTETDRNWIRATYYTGVMGLYRTTRDPEVLDQAIRWGEKHGWAEGDERAPANKKTCGQTYLELYFIEPHATRIAKIRAYVDSRMAKIDAGESPLEGWYYCDTLYVGPPTIAMLGRATGEEKYYDYLNKVYWAVTDHLFDKQYGLFYRDETYFDTESRNGRKVFWSRGNGWVLGGIPRVLQYLPKDNEYHDRYVELFRAMCAAIAKRQGADGLWRSNLDDPDEYPNPETSGTAFFCYAMAWGINNGVLDRQKYLPVVMKAWKGLVRHVQSDGKLGYVQPVGASPKPATREMTHEYAMGLFLLSGEEMVKLVESGVITEEARKKLQESDRRLTDPRASIVSLAGHPLQAKIDAFLRRQAAIEGFEPTGLTREDYLGVIDGQVKVMQTYQDLEGRIIDPVEKIEKYYATPCYAHGVAVLAASGHNTDAALVESGMKALDVSLADMAAATAAGGHGDFYTWPVMFAYELFGELATPQRRTGWENTLAAIRPEKLYRAGPNSANWNVVNLAGEYLRATHGLSGMEYVESCLGSQLSHFTSLGMYSEHGNPLPYDHFPRHYLAGMLHRGYRGELYMTYRDLLWRGAWTSLFMQSPTGQLPTGYRSSHHIWNEAEQAVTFEIYAAHCAKEGRLAEAGAFKRAARLSLASIKRWIRPDGSGYIVKNRYAIEARHGYEDYSAHTCYNLLACSMLAQAWQFADDKVEERPAPADVGGFVLPILDPFHKVFANAGGTYVEYDTCGDHKYNPTGLIRVHLGGGHPQLGPSDGCAPKYSGPGVNLAVGPEWQDAAGWHRLAASTALTPTVEILDETPKLARFRIVYQLDPSCRADVIEGRFDKAYGFADPASRVVSAEPVDFARGDYAISMWFRPGGGGQRQALLVGTLNGHHALYLEVQNKTIRFLHRCPPGNKGGTDVFGELTESVSGAWHHVVAMKRKDKLNLCLDGKPAASARDQTSFGGPLRIILANLYETPGERHFSGAIDELRLYPRSLSPTEIEMLHAGEELDLEPAACWSFDEPPKASPLKLAETIIVQPQGVTVEDELLGEGVTAIRVNYPMLVFDGLKHTRIDVNGSSFFLTMEGSGIRVTIVEPSDAVWIRSGRTLGHRNGLVERASTEICGSRAVYRIEPVADSGR